MTDTKSLMKLKVVDLRERLQTMGKTPKGLKADLVKQLQEALEESSVSGVSGNDEQLMRTQEYQPSIVNEPYVSIDDGMDSMSNPSQTILSAALTQSSDERSAHSAHTAHTSHDGQYYPQTVGQYAPQVYDSSPVNTYSVMSTHTPYDTSQYQYTPHATHTVFSPQHEPYNQNESQYQLTPIPTLSLTPQLAPQLTPQMTAQYQTAYQSPESSHYSHEYSAQTTPNESLYGITRIDMQTMSQTQPQAPIIHRSHNAAVINTGLELPQTATLPPNIAARVDPYDVNSSIVTESLKQTPYHSCANSEPPLVQTDAAEDMINFDDVSLGVDASAENAYDSFEAVPNQSEFELRVPPNVYEHHLESHRYRDQRLSANTTHHLQSLIPNPNDVNQINSLNNNSIMRDQTDSVDNNYSETSIRNEPNLQSNQICINNYDIESNQENSSDTIENDEEVKTDYINNVELKADSNVELSDENKVNNTNDIQQTEPIFTENKQIEEIKTDECKEIEKTIKIGEIEDLCIMKEENEKIDEKVELERNAKTEHCLEIEKTSELQESEENLENRDYEEKEVIHETDDKEENEKIVRITQIDEENQNQLIQHNDSVELNEETHSLTNEQQIETNSNIDETLVTNETQLINDNQITNEQSLNTNLDFNANISIENDSTDNIVNNEEIDDLNQQNNLETRIVLSPDENQPPKRIIETSESELIENNLRNGTVDSFKRSKEKLTKNQKRKQRKKLKAKMRKLNEKDDQEDDDRMDIEDDEDDQHIEIEYIPEQLKKDPIYFQYLRVFDKFMTGETDRKDHDLHEEEIIDPVKKMLERKKPVELELKDEDTKKDGEPKLSKRKLKQMTRMTVAELKQRVSHPELVEMHDVTARDPLMLLHLKATRNSVPVPRHWCYKRKYLQGKRGFEKAPFKLPEFIRKTGIMEMRQALQEKEDAKSLKAKMREKIRPKMGKIDIDYQKLHDAFFKWQTKPKMTIHGDLYYEGKEFETRLKEKKPGELSNDLRTALGMPTGPNAQKCPPPWLIAMQRYGPPPSYPNIKIPGLNAPIPEGCSFGYHAGGWGKPPVDEYGRPLYGDVFGVTSTTDINHIEEEVDRTLWGELESESESEEEVEEEETESPTASGVTAKAATGKEVDETGFVTPAEGLITPSGLTSIPTGMETPDMIELRKRKQIEAEMESGENNPALYTVIPEKKIDKMGREMMGSAHTYDISAATLRKGQGVDVALDPSDLEMGSLDTASVAARYEQTIKEQSSHLAKEDLSDMVAEHAARQKRKKQQDTGKSSKKYNQFKF